MTHEIKWLCEQVKWAEIDEDSGENADVYLSSDDELDALEKFAGAPLPKDYRWLMKHYGMRSFVDDERVNIRINGISLSFLAHFSDARDTLYASELYSGSDDKRIPPQTLVIADSLSRDLLVMGLSEQSYGKIYYISSWKPWGAFDDEDYMVKLADSFNQLLTMVVENHSPEEPDFNIPDDKIL
ncbi:SMI1/KNR4 family protein [Shewanella corallii]|uniref:SMI1/KNR4 family protein n=1 Tax=Shewanella corallii TaxID=560080 RepID=A0ABT0N1U6_9GAMM|nr:SMI1/KNR4 family protein [Shewanella corallii]MCL2912396.1 SMI1/KNR4 family protein [Shewanella corallii]